MNIDQDKEKRYKELQSIFIKKREKNYIEKNYKGFDYYIEIKHRDNSQGIRWFHRNKWLCEVVLTTEEGHKNLAPFALFSTLDDCLLQAMLVEDSMKWKIDHKEYIKREG